MIPKLFSNHCKITAKSLSTEPPKKNRQRRRQRRRRRRWRRRKGGRRRRRQRRKVTPGLVSALTFAVPYRAPSLSSPLAGAIPVGVQEPQLQSFLKGCFKAVLKGNYRKQRRFKDYYVHPPLSNIPICPSENTPKQAVVGCKKISRNGPRICTRWALTDLEQQSQQTKKNWAKISLKTLTTEKACKSQIPPWPKSSGFPWFSMPARVLELFNIPNWSSTVPKWESCRWVQALFLQCQLELHIWGLPSKDYRAPWGISVLLPPAKLNILQQTIPSTYGLSLVRICFLLASELAISLQMFHGGTGASAGWSKVWSWQVNWISKWKSRASPVEGPEKVGSPCQVSSRSFLGAWALRKMTNEKQVQKKCLSSLTDGIPWRIFDISWPCCPRYWIQGRKAQVRADELANSLQWATQRVILVGLDWIALAGTLCRGR